MPAITTILTDEVTDLLRDTARAQGVSVSSLVKKCVENCLYSGEVATDVKPKNGGSRAVFEKERELELMNATLREKEELIRVLQGLLKSVQEDTTWLRRQYEDLKRIYEPLLFASRRGPKIG